MLILKNKEGDIKLVIYEEHVSIVTLEPAGNDFEPGTRITYATQKGNTHTVFCPLPIKDILPQIPIINNTEETED